MLRRAAFHLARRCGLHLLKRHYRSHQQFTEALDRHDQQKLFSQRRYKSLTRDLQQKFEDRTSALYLLKYLDAAKTYVVDVSWGERGLFFAVYDTTAELDGRVGYHPPKGEKVRGRFRYQVIAGKVHRAELSATEAYLNAKPLFVRRHPLCIS